MRALIVKKGIRSPWGKVQNVEHITPWLSRVSTATHGGFKLAPNKNKYIPNDLRRKGCWYEEDCEVSIIFVYLEDQIKIDIFDECKQFYTKWIDNGSFKESLTRYFGVIL